MLDTLYIRLAEVTGREVDEIRADARRGRFLTVPEAVAYGLIDGQASPEPGRGREATVTGGPCRPGQQPGAGTAPARGRPRSSGPTPGWPRRRCCRRSGCTWPGTPSGCGSGSSAGHRAAAAAPAVLGVPVGGRPGAGPVPARPAGQRPRPGRAGPRVRVGPGGDRGRAGGRGVGHPERDRPARRRRHHAQRGVEPGPASRRDAGDGAGRADRCRPAARRPRRTWCWPGTRSTTGAWPRGCCPSWSGPARRARWCWSATRAGPTCPGTGSTQVAAYDVPVERVIEDADVKPTTVWRLR